MPSRRAAHLSLTLLLAAGATVPAGLGCTNEASTEPGDRPADAGVPSALGNGFRITELNDPSSSNRPVNDQLNVNVTGAQFIIKDTYAETGTASSVGNIYVQDFQPTDPDAGPVPYSGIILYKTTFEPASLNLSPGDAIDFTGEYQEYAGPSTFSFGSQYQPEMYESVATFRFDYSLPAPKVLEVTELLSYATGYKWMSMLVTLVGPGGGDLIGGGSSQGSENRGGIYLTSDQSQGALIMDNELFPLDYMNPAWQQSGLKIKSVTGVVTYFGSFTFSPRSMDDIVFDN